MINQDIKQYLLLVRSWVGKNQIIIVPDTPAYHLVLRDLNDENIIIKRPNMDLTKLGRKIIKD